MSQVSRHGGPIMHKSAGKQEQPSLRGEFDKMTSETI